MRDWREGGDDKLVSEGSNAKKKEACIYRARAHHDPSRTPGWCSRFSETADINKDIVVLAVIYLKRGPLKIKGVS